jgi:hypothetical protein
MYFRAFAAGASSVIAQERVAEVGVQNWLQAPWRKIDSLETLAKLAKHSGWLPK